MIDRGKHNVLGINISAVDYDAAVEQVIAAARASRSFAVSALAVHGLMTGVLNAEQRFRLNQFDLLVPDGQPVRWALNYLHCAQLGDRVYGPTLMIYICQRAAEDKLPVFLYGSTADVLAKLCRNLSQRFPGLAIAGTRPSRFRRLDPAERDETVAAIHASGAAITFVGLGCPRQEVWAFEFREALSQPVLAVGAAFNFHAALLPQAPPAMQKRGLEWLFRLYQEPRRLWKRYLLLNPLFLVMLGLQATGLRKFDPADARRPSRQVLYG